MDKVIIASSTFINFIGLGQGSIRVEVVVVINQFIWRMIVKRIVISIGVYRYLIKELFMVVIAIVMAVIAIVMVVNPLVLWRNPLFFFIFL